MIGLKELKIKIIGVALISLPRLLIHPSIHYTGWFQVSFFAVYSKTVGFRGKSILDDRRRNLKTQLFRPSMTPCDLSIPNYDTYPRITEIR